MQLGNWKLAHSCLPVYLFLSCLLCSELQKNRKIKKRNFEMMEMFMLRHKNSREFTTFIANILRRPSCFPLFYCAAYRISFSQNKHFYQSIPLLSIEIDRKFRQWTQMIRWKDKFEFDGKAGVLRCADAQIPWTSWSVL